MYLPGRKAHKVFTVFLLALSTILVVWAAFSVASLVPSVVPSRPSWTEEDVTKALKALEIIGIPHAGNRYHETLCDENTLCLSGAAGETGTRESIVREKQLTLMVNGKILTVDDIVYGYEKLFETRAMYSQLTFMGYGLQQDPNDAFVISDLLWRVRPRLVIELGTSGGGGALFYARSMLGYDPHARVITIDPANGTAELDGTPLRNWNQIDMDTFCPHCEMPKDSTIFKNAVTFIRKLPVSALDDVKRILAQRIYKGYPVMVIEDSNHQYSVVKENLRAFADIVSPGAYFIVQDTRTGRQPVGTGPTKAIREFMQTSQEFVRDRRPEYLLFSQHSGGFLRKLRAGEIPNQHWDELE